MGNWLKLTKRIPPPCLRRKGGWKKKFIYIIAERKKKSMNMETKGLGAGSYPEPPFVPASSSPMCDRCGDPDGLLEVGGMVLCRYCREKFYLEACRDKM